MNIIKETNCCGKPMYKVGTPSLNTSETYSEAYVCLECGTMKYYVEEELDEEILENYKEMAEGENETQM